MSHKKQQHIPDASGTIALSGMEGLASMYVLKDRFVKALTEELSTAKLQLRSAARTAITSAAAGARRVFIRDGAGGGVGVTLPDYESEGNRTLVSEDTLKEIAKAGGLEALEVPAQELLDTLVEPGGEQLILRGRWLDWFRSNLILTGQVKLEGDPDIELKTVKPKTTQRLKFPAIARLQAIAASGTEAAKRVARLLLDGGLKEMIVKAEKE